PSTWSLSSNVCLLYLHDALPILLQSSHVQITREAAGTTTYMAPEQVLGKPRAASDQYALGVVVYEWLTGNPPFRGSLNEVTTQQDRKSTRLNSSHVAISYAVCCL